eukprot:1696311-Pleurochrysis_carterae.AAC.1
MSLSHCSCSSIHTCTVSVGLRSACCSLHIALLPDQKQRYIKDKNCSRKRAKTNARNAGANGGANVEKWASSAKERRDHKLPMMVCCW